MNGSRGVNRRQLLQLLASVGITASVLGGYALAASSKKVVLDRSFFQNLEIDLEKLERYVALFDESTDGSLNQEDLEAEIFGRSLSRLGTAEMKRLLKSRIASDFTQGQTVRLDGWVLSRTEVQVWAVYLLLFES